MYIRDRADGFDVIVEQDDSADETSHIIEVIKMDILKLISEVNERGCSRLAVYDPTFNYNLMAEYKNEQWHFYYCGNEQYKVCFFNAMNEVYNLGEIKESI